MATIGLDFGSTYCTMSWINPKSGKVEPIKMTEGDGSVKYPSLIIGTLLELKVGYSAVHYADMLPNLSADEQMKAIASTVKCIKQVMSPDGTEILNKKKYTHKALLVQLFKSLKKQAEVHIGNGTVVDSVIFSYPVEMSESKKKLIQDSLMEAGLYTLDKVEEPVAAVYGYEAEHEVKNGTGILVFDFGGGTTDVAYVSKQMDHLAVSVQPRGNNTCGGQDLDAILYEYFRAEIKKTHAGADITQKGFMRNIGVLNFCRFMKEQLCISQQSQAFVRTVLINGNAVDYEFRLSYSKFNELISPKVNEAVQVAKTVQNDVLQKHKPIHKILLIGGSSQIPLVQDLLGKLGDCSVESCGEKDVVVALGTLRYAIANGVIKVDKEKTNTTQGTGTSTGTETPKTESKKKPEPQKPTGPIVKDDGGEMMFNW